MRHIVQMVLALTAAGGAVLCWRRVTRLVDVAPVADGQPGTVSVIYNPPVMLLVWLLAVTAGILVVLAVAGLIRRRAARRH